MAPVVDALFATADAPALTQQIGRCALLLIFRANPDVVRLQRVFYPDSDRPDPSHAFPGSARVGKLRAAA